VVGRGVALLSCRSFAGMGSCHFFFLLFFHCNPDALTIAWFFSTFVGGGGNVALHSRSVAAKHTMSGTFLYFYRILCSHPFYCVVCVCLVPVA